MSASLPSFNFSSAAVNDSVMGAFGKSCRIDLIVLRISERLLPVMIVFQAATNLSRDPYGIVCYVLFTSIEIKK